LGIACHEATMRICLDAHMIGSQETGNETYVVSLAPALASLENIDCVAAIEPEAPVPNCWADAQPAIARLHPAGDWLRLGYTLPKICRNWHADLLHVTYIAPFTSPCPIIVTIHDVIFQRFPEFFSARDRLLFATLLPLTLRRAAAVITDSECSRTDIAAFYPFAADKVFAVPLAPAPTFRPTEPTAARQVCDRYAVASQFILAVGNLQPRKNLLRLVAAFRSLLTQGLHEYQLVLVGKDALHSEEFRAEVRDLVESGHLAFTGYVPEHDLPALYSAAAAFVYPSIYEGFGLPLLEAMSCGAPVITSDRSSMPEVAGDAAVLVDPTRTDRIAAALYTVLTQSNLADGLRRRGQARAAQFTWDATASQTAEVYQWALQASKRASQDVAV
jgi:glycosyltransferase involved in cell wall biosynthesis